MGLFSKIIGTAAVAATAATVAAAGTYLYSRWTKNKESEKKTNNDAIKGMRREYEKLLSQQCQKVKMRDDRLIYLEKKILGLVDCIKNCETLRNRYLEEKKGLQERIAMLTVELEREKNKRNVATFHEKWVQTFDRNKIYYDYYRIIITSKKAFDL